MIIGFLFKCFFGWRSSEIRWSKRNNVCRYILLMRGEVNWCVGNIIYFLRVELFSVINKF